MSTESFLPYEFKLWNANQDPIWNHWGTKIQNCHQSSACVTEFFNEHSKNLLIIFRDQTLKISVIDRDTCSSDDLIGSTIIDIEDRFRSRHFATFGLPQEYNTTGC